MPTYEVSCSHCGDLRWPTLPYRPAAYLCVRCAAVEPSKRVARREQAARGHKTRLRASGDPTGPEGSAP